MKKFISHSLVFSLLLTSLTSLSFSKTSSINSDDVSDDSKSEEGTDVASDDGSDEGSEEGSVPPRPKALKKVPFPTTSASFEFYDKDNDRPHYDFALNFSLKSIKDEAGPYIVSIEKNLDGKEEVWDGEELRPGQEYKIGNKLLSLNLDDLLTNQGEHQDKIEKLNSQDDDEFFSALQGLGCRSVQESDNGKDVGDDSVSSINSEDGDDETKEEEDEVDDEDLDQEGDDEDKDCYLQIDYPDATSSPDNEEHFINVKHLMNGNAEIDLKAARVKIIKPITEKKLNIIDDLMIEKLAEEQAKLEADASYQSQYNKNEELVTEFQDLSDDLLSNCSSFCVLKETEKVGNILLGANRAIQTLNQRVANQSLTGLLKEQICTLKEFLDRCQENDKTREKMENLQTASQNLGFADLKSACPTEGSVIAPPSPVEDPVVDKDEENDDETKTESEGRDHSSNHGGRRGGYSGASPSLGGAIPPMYQPSYRNQGQGNDQNWMYMMAPWFIYNMNQQNNSHQNKVYMSPYMYMPMMAF